MCGVSAKPAGVAARFPQGGSPRRYRPGPGAGDLGWPDKPFATQADPAQPGPFQVRNFAVPAGLTVEQLGERRQLLQEFDTLRRDLDASGQMAGLDRFNQQAWE